MHAFSVAPFDQNLSIDGKILSDDCATLGTLGVIPESVILLKVGNTLSWRDLDGWSMRMLCVVVVKGASGPWQHVVVSSCGEFCCLYIQSPPLAEPWET